MERKKVFPSVTGLKGIFSWIIVWFHVAPQTPFVSAIPCDGFIKSCGGILGNTMFFMISGFLVSWAYRDRIRNGGIRFFDYVKGRLSKVYPTYVVTTIVMVCLCVGEYGASAINLQNIAFDLLLQSGAGFVNTASYNGPAWFFNALFVCYLVYFFIAYHAKEPTAYRCCMALGVAWGYALYCADWKFPYMYNQNGIAFMNFFIGCIIAEVYPYITKQLSRKLQAASFVIVPASLYLMLRYGAWVIAGDLHTAFGFVICPMILYLALDNRLCAWILERKPFLWLGKISVQVYLWHFVLFVANRWGLRTYGKEMGTAGFFLFLVILLIWASVPVLYQDRKRKARMAEASKPE